jgi:hypothetical protein
MRTLMVLLVLAGPVWAQAPAASAAPEAPMPPFRVTYELVAGGPQSTPQANRLEASYDGRQGKLVLDLTEMGKPEKRVFDPWPESDARALWRELERARLFDFKPQKGDPAPHFGEVKLSAEVGTGGQKRAVSHAWNAPLRNDGQIWPLVNHLDQLMNAPAPAAPSSARPQGSTVPREPSSEELPVGPSPAGSPAPLDPR